MSSVTLNMPSLGETMEEGTVSEWLVAEGDSFDRGAPLVEFETDKTAVEYPALGAGRLVKLLVSPGDVVKIGDPIAEIDLMGGEDWVGASQADAQPDTPDVAEPEPAAPEKQPADAEPTPTDGPVRATPLARRAASKAGLDIATLRGSGRRGRIELDDVQRVIEGKGGAMASEHWGPATGTPVLLVHGFSGDRLTFEQLGKSLGRSGMAARAVDLPSHGQTLATAQRFEDLVDALSAELDPNHPVHLVGHSIGAAVCIAAAARRGGAASLTLIAPAGLGLGIDADFVSGMARAESAGAVGHYLRRLSERAESFSPQIIADIHATLAQGRLTSLADDLCKGGQQTVNMRAELAHLADDIPVRALVGTEDQIVDWDDVLDVSPAIAIHVFPRSGHMPHWDAPAAVAALLTKGLSDG